jgi:hypothetical protein
LRYAFLLQASAAGAPLEGINLTVLATTSSGLSETEFLRRRSIR